GEPPDGGGSVLGLGRYGAVRRTRTRTRRSVTASASAVSMAAWLAATTPDSGAHLGVHGDVRPFGHAELDRGHPVLETGSRVRAVLAHPNVLHPVHPSRARSRSRTPARLRSSFTQRRMPALGCGSVTVNTR